MSAGLIQLASRAFRRSSDSPRMFAFGKLPQFGDFVSRNLENAPWLAQFFEALAMHGRIGHPDPWFDLGQPAQRVYLRHAAWFVPRAEAMFAMAASRDLHGRQFPFAMGWYAKKLDSTTAHCGSESLSTLSETEQWIVDAPAILSQVLRENCAPIQFPNAPSHDLGSGLFAWRTDQALVGTNAG